MSVSASAVSSPSIPGGASSNGRSFASGGCGAWSVAMASMVPSASPRLIAATSASVRSGGFTLNIGSNVAHALVGEREVVRRGLGGDREAARLRGAHELDRARGGDVQEVHARAGELGEDQVAGDDDVFGRRRPARGCRGGSTTSPSCMRAAARRASASSACCAITAPGQRRRVLERAPHHAGVGDARAVVGEDPHAELVQLAHRRELLARRGPW